mgnify:CR=1 FL=1
MMENKTSVRVSGNAHHFGLRNRCIRTILVGLQSQLVLTPFVTVYRFMGGVLRF